MQKVLNLFQDVGGLFLEDSWAIARNFDKSRELMTLQQNPNSTCIFEFSFKYLYRV